MNSKLIESNANLDIHELALAAQQLTFARSHDLDDQELCRMAVACAVLEEFEPAERYLEWVLRRSPTSLEGLLNFGVVKLRQGLYREASEVFARGLRMHVDCPDLLFNAGVASFAVAEFQQSTEFLTRYLAVNPADSSALLYCAQSELELGNRNLAESYCQQINWMDLDGVRELYELASLWVNLERPGDAELLYQKIHRQFPEEYPAVVNLAGIYERSNRLADAEGLLSSVPRHVVKSPYYWLISAKLALAKGDGNQALASVAEAGLALADHKSLYEKAKLECELEFIKGQALNSLGQYEHAYAAFFKGNALVRDRYRNLVASEHDREMTWLSDYPELDQYVTSTKVQDLAQQSPVFLVGFPRSGTTLLDQILDSHREIQVMEEKPALENVLHEIELRYGTLQAGIAAMGASEVVQFRQQYWSYVSKYVAVKDGHTFVDKYPLALVRLQVAMKLFPSAKWIFASRHPFDVILSCFMQNFRFTNATHGFWTIEETADIYVRSMELWMNQRERLIPKCLDVRYEDLIQDLPSGINSLVSFLDLQKNEEMLRYFDHAKSRRISTPSYAQVVQPIYKTAEGRWRKYADQIAPIRDRVKPIAARLGYSVY